MAKYFDGMGNDMTSYVQSLEQGQEKLKAQGLEIIQLKAEVERLSKVEPESPKKPRKKVS
jgi:hypothetical protein